MQDILARYQRQIVLPGFGIEGQQQLQAASIACVGVGGLGSSALFYLAAAGVGRLTIIDDDLVEVSNLQRQILYKTEQQGQVKVKMAQQCLSALNPHIEVVAHVQKLDEKNADSLLESCDIVLDGSDNFMTRYFVNDMCYTLKKPLVHASVSQWQGQCTVFMPEQSACYRCLFPLDAENLSDTGNCSQSGVLGVLPGLLGVLQATEAIKLILKQGEPLLGRMLLVDAQTMQFNQWVFSRDPECALCSHRKPSEALATLAQASKQKKKEQKKMKEIPSLTVEELAQWFVHPPQPFQLIDVRRVDERAEGKIEPSLSIPINTLSEKAAELDPESCYVVHCGGGRRSLKGALILRDLGFRNVYNLQGGMTAWESRLNSI